MIDDAIAELEPLVGIRAACRGDRPAAGHPLPPSPQEPCPHAPATDARSRSRGR